MAGGSTAENNCDQCGKPCPKTQQRCDSCIAKVKVVIPAKFYPTAHDTINKTNAK